MKFTPKTDEELAEMNLIEAGKYSFEVLEAAEEVSKSGKDMIKLKLKIWDNNGRERVVFDYLLEAMAFKLKHFCDVAGLEHKYKDGSFNAMDCLGKCGTLELTVRTDKTGQYGPQNAVKDYVNEPSSTIKKQNDDHLFDDQDIPF